MSFATESAAWDAVETAEKIRAREVSAREVIDAAIERARASDLDAIVTETFDVEPPASGRFAGVPTFIKDLAQIEGVKTSWGSASAGTFVSRRTDPSIRRLLRATGLASLGKSATPEYGLTATTEPIGRPPCRNPRDRSRTPGGSSGGAAALVASGVVPIAHASDGGGSIRIPAACTGTVGFKPSRGRFDMDASQFLPVNVAVMGVITRTVRDTIAFWDAIDPLPDRKTGALRIGAFSEAPLGTPVDPEHREAVVRAAELCAQLGHRVEEIACPVDGQFSHDFVRLWGLLGFLYLRSGKLLTHRGFDASRLEPWTRGLASHFERDLGGAFAAIGRLRRFGARYAQIMERFDVLICPTLAEPPPPLGYLATDVEFGAAYDRLVKFVPFTPIQNVAGAPAITLPLAQTKSGLPIGIQLAGARGSDQMLLGLARALEETIDR